MPQAAKCNGTFLSRIPFTKACIKVNGKCCFLNIWWITIPVGWRPPLITTVLSFVCGTNKVSQLIRPISCNRLNYTEWSKQHNRLQLYSQENNHCVFVRVTDRGCEVLDAYINVWIHYICARREGQKQCAEVCFWVGKIYSYSYVCVFTYAFLCVCMCTVCFLWRCVFPSQHFLYL